MADVMSEFYDGPHATPPESETGPIYLGIKNLTPHGLLDLSQVRQEAFASRSRPVRNLLTTLDQQARGLAEVRNLLLPRLISGDLDISDLNLGLEAVG